MSKWEKMLARIRKMDPDLRFSEIKKVLESYGYVGTFPNGVSNVGAAGFQRRGCVLCDQLSGSSGLPDSRAYYCGSS